MQNKKERDRVNKNGRKKTHELLIRRLQNGFELRIVPRFPSIPTIVIVALIKTKSRDQYVLNDELLVDDETNADYFRK